MGFQHGLSGLNAASKNLDVVGQNIANSSTIGFKSSRTEFSALVAAAAAGGSNSGMGVTASSSQQFSQGVITPSSNPLDVAINGNGFFCVQTTKGDIGYTRMGNFQLNSAGDLVTANGEKVLVKKLDANGNPVDGAPEGINMSSKGMPAKATTKISASINLDARTAAGTSRAASGTSLQVYDSLGIKHGVSMYFEKDPANANTWFIYDGLDDPADQPTPIVRTPLATVSFDANGEINEVTAPGTGVTPLTDPVGFSFAFTPDPATGATTPLQISVNLNDVTQYGNAFNVSKLSQDGYEAGTFVGINVAEDGSLMASYSNGVTRAEARLAMATFINPQGLMPTSNGNWLETRESGQPTPRTAGLGGAGSIGGSALEESNVDLTAELVAMMTAQRYYQANAQTIKTQDQAFSTITNLR